MVKCFVIAKYLMGSVIMLKLPMKIRVILGIAALLLFGFLALIHSNCYGELFTLLVLPGGYIFIWLNPELMRGD